MKTYSEFLNEAQHFLRSIRKDQKPWCDEIKNIAKAAAKEAASELEKYDAYELYKNALPQYFRGTRWETHGSCEISMNVKDYDIDWEYVSQYEMEDAIKDALKNSGLDEFVSYNEIVSFGNGGHLGFESKSICGLTNGQFEPECGDDDFGLSQIISEIVEVNDINVNINMTDEDIRAFEDENDVLFWQFKDEFMNIENKFLRFSDALIDAMIKFSSECDGFMEAVKIDQREKRNEEDEEYEEN